MGPIHHPSAANRRDVSGTNFTVRLSAACCYSMFYILDELLRRSQERRGFGRRSGPA